MGGVIAGRFELLNPIGSGASGTVWQAWDRRRQAECAAKVLRHKDSAELLRFVREQGVRLDHPHLATPYGWAAEDDDVAIAMPLVRGGTLETALRDHGAFSPALTAVLLKQLLDGLAHVHEAGWLHRDVKPANILLEATGTARPHLRLGDFGIALRQDDPRLTAVGTVTGTPGYLAPEATHGAPPSRENDLYAVGVTALRMLHPEVDGCDVAARLDELPVTGEFKQFLARLLSQDPADRLLAAQTVGNSPCPEPPGPLLVASEEPFEVFDQIDAAAEPQQPPAPVGTGAPQPPPSSRWRQIAARLAPVSLGLGLMLLVIAGVVALLT